MCVDRRRTAEWQKRTTCWLHEKTSSRTIGVFLSPGDTYFYSPEYARIVFAEQICWLLNGRPGNYDSIDDASYKSLLYKLQKIAKHKPITFVLDGLAEKSLPENRLKSEILNLLPFGPQEFRFLISGTDDLEADIRSRCKSTKSVPLIQIAQEEAIEFFSDITYLSHQDISDIRRFCAGSIGRLTKLKTIIQTNKTSLDEILNNKSGHLEDLMELEWIALEKNETQRRQTAFLCFANRPLSVTQLALSTNADRDETRQYLEKNSFIDITPISELVSIRSNTQKIFLRKKLNFYEQEVQSYLLDELLKNPESLDTDRYLPTQLMQVGKYDDLVKRLDIAYFCRVLNNEKSLRSLRANFDLGIRAAKQLKNEQLVSQFGMGKSAIGGITLSVGSKSRVETLITMGNVEAAIELSLAAPTREERLRYLAAIANTLFEERKTIPNNVRSEISSLLSDLSVETLGDMAIAIACDLIAVDLDAAVDLFNRANSTSKNEKTSGAIGKKDKQNEHASDENRISDQSTLEIRMSERHQKRFSEALGHMVDRTSPEKVCARVRESTDYSSDLMFLKAWIGRRRSDPQAYVVANAAVDLILKDLTRSPRIEDLRAIAGVLPHIFDLAEAEKLSKRIQTLASTDLFLGNSVEAVRLRMLLLETQYRQTRPEAELGLLDVLLETETLEDLGTRVACLSWILFALKQFSDADTLEKKTSLISHTTTELMKSIESLLQNSADHFVAIKMSLPALARVDVELAMQVCKSLNTEERRDSAYSTLLGELFILKKYTSNPGYVIQCANDICDENLRSTSILQGLSTIAHHLKAGQVHHCNDGILNLWRKLRLPNYRFIGLRYALQIGMQIPGSKIDLFKSEILKCWEDNEIDWVRWELGYSLVRNTYALDKNFGEEWLDRVTSEESTQRSPSESVNDVLKLTSSLAIRAFSHLASANFEDSDDFNKLVRLISAMAVPDERLLMWCELGIRLFYSGKTNFSKHICKTYVEQLIPVGKTNQDNLYGFGNEITLSHAAPFIYITHESTGQFVIDKISCPTRKDAAISGVCFTLLRKVAATDSYKDYGGEGYDLDAQTATSIIALLGKMSTDSQIFSVLCALVESLSARKNERKIRRIQVAEFLSSLEDLVRKLLPDKRNIKHAGYLISSLSVINKARQNAKLTVESKNWTNLYKDARLLKNVSDRAVVTAFVGVGARGKPGVIPEDWIEEIKKDVNLSPTIIDQIDRYAWLAEIFEELEKKESLAFARLGMSLTKNVGSDINIYDRKKKLLDLVFNIDPELAEDFIELSDGDRARKNDRAALEARIKLQRLQKSILTDPEKTDLSEESDSDVAELSMRNLGKLNANRLAPRNVEDFEKLSLRALGLPFESAYCVWSWMLENAIKKSGFNSKGEKVVNNFFKASLNAGELIVSLVYGSVSALSAGGCSQTGLVKPGDRDNAITIILDWAKHADNHEIIISDPYFSPDDVDFLFEITKTAPHAIIRILTGRRHLKAMVPDGNFESAFGNAWRSICDATSSSIEISVIGVNIDGDHPIHDRWLLSTQSGLRLGTSAKSLGNFKVSEISEISIEEAQARLELIKGFMEKRTKFWESNRVFVSSFDLH